MRSMVLVQPGQPLRSSDSAVPHPGEGEVLVKVAACAVCRTDLHIADGELPHPKLPLVLGHEIVGTVMEAGRSSQRFAAGDRVGIPWLGSICGVCSFCRLGQENLCDRAEFTGYTRDGGYAEFTTADERFCVPIPEIYSDAEAAPLLCAGLIGYRSLKKAGDAGRLGIYGFGAAAHIITQVAAYQGRRVYAFTRGGNVAGQVFAKSLGAHWAGASNEIPPDELDAAIILAPAGELVPTALKATRKGGVVVCGGIHMSDIPSFPYTLLWGERQICSVANLTRKDAEEFMHIAPQVPVRTSVELFALEQANEALEKLRTGQVRGAAVLKM